MLPYDVQRSPNNLVGVNSTPSKLQLARHHSGDIEEVLYQLCLPLRVRVNGIDRSITIRVALSRVNQMTMQMMECDKAAEIGWIDEQE